MNKIKDRLAALINVKSIVTLMVMIVFSILSLTGVIQSDAVMQIVMMVVAFYFGTQHQKEVDKKDGEK